MTHLLYTYLTNENNDSFFADAQNNFSEEFINKISNYKRWEDAKATVLGRLLLAYGLKHFYNYDLEQLKMRYSKDKKPYLEDSAIQFNISHSKELIVCAITSLGDVGVDVEKINELNIDDFKDQFSSLEYRRMRNSKNALESFYHHWTQKEAIVKAHGSGLNIPLNSFEINNNTTIIENKQYFLKEIVLNSQYKCNVATHNIISDNVMELTCLKSKLLTDFGSSNSLKSFR